MSFFLKLHPTPLPCKGVLITCVVSVVILTISCYILTIFAFKGQRNDKMADILTETYRRTEQLKHPAAPLFSAAAVHYYQLNGNHGLARFGI
jgi:hypothetical protein